MKYADAVQAVRNGIDLVESNPHGELVTVTRDQYIGMAHGMLALAEREHLTLNEIARLITAIGSDARSEADNELGSKLISWYEARRREGID